jgi:hypothetical protein
MVANLIIFAIVFRVAMTKCVIYVDVFGVAKCLISWNKKVAVV